MSSSERKYVYKTMERSVETNDGMDLITSVQKIKTITYFHSKMEVYCYSQLTKQPNQVS